MEKKIENSNFGDIIICKSFYEHYALSLGDKIVHFADPENNPDIPTRKLNAKIHTIDKQNFIKIYQNCFIIIKKCNFEIDKIEILKRIKDMMMDPHKWKLLFNNCEHFVNYCLHGRFFSSQVLIGGLSLALAGCCYYNGYGFFESSAIGASSFMILNHIKNYNFEI